MNPRRPVAPAARWCGSCVALLLSWAVWLVLGGLLAAQIWIATHRELPLPDFALRYVEKRLAASNVSARFGQAVFDPTGRILLQDVAVYSPSYATPLLTIRAAYVRLDFWAMLVGNLRLEQVRLTGVDLRVPAMLSPTGTDEAVVSDLDGSFQIGKPDYHIDLCTFRLGRVQVAMRGGFHLPKAVRPHPGSLPILDLILQRYLDAGRRLLALRPKLEGLERPELQLVLVPSEARGAQVEASLFVQAYRGAGPVSTTTAVARAAFPLLGASAETTRIALDVDRWAWKDQASGGPVRLDLDGRLTPDRMTFKPQRLFVTAGRSIVRGIAAGPVSADLALDRFPIVQGRIALQAGGAPFGAHGRLNVKHGDGTVALSGQLTPALLQRAAGIHGLASARWVTLSGPAQASGVLVLTPGWKPARIEGDVSVEHVVAHEVPLDAAGAHLVFTGRELHVTGLYLRQGANLASGTYAMDTATRDYRFVLHGRLRPLDISGWFHGWWPHFWSNFDFSKTPPAADVDIRGRWKDPSATSVFCHVDAAHPGIRGVYFDRVRTTLFVRPFYFDVFSFHADQAGHSARGSFVLSVVPHEPVYRTLDFDAVSDLDPTQCAAMYGPAGMKYVAPYRFVTPPRVHLTGHLIGPQEPGGRQTDINIHLLSGGDFSFHGFALTHVTFDAWLKNDRLDLQQVQAQVAGGSLSGHARLQGPPADRRLTFDAVLKNANLADAINAAERLQPSGRSATTPRTKPPLLVRSAGGRLDAALAATGRYRELYSYHGDGSFTIKGRELGEIHLLGLLSELLSKNHLNFTSLRLDAATGRFKVDGNKLAFSQVKLTGPSAAIEAKGNYLLDTRRLDFNANVFPLQESSFLPADLLGAVLTPLSIALELRLTGTIEKPSWALLLGPTNLLRTLTRPLMGDSKPASAKPAPPPSTPPRKSPESGSP